MPGDFQLGAGIIISFPGDCPFLEKFIDSTVVCHIIGKAGFSLFSGRQGYLDFFTPRTGFQFIQPFSCRRHPGFSFGCYSLKFDIFQLDDFLSLADKIPFIHANPGNSAGYFGSQLNLMVWDDIPAGGQDFLPHPGRVYF